MDKDFSNFYIRMLHKFPATEHQKRLGFLTAPQLSSSVSKEVLESYKNEWRFIQENFCGQTIQTPQGTAGFYENFGTHGFGKDYGFILLDYFNKAQQSDNFLAVREYIKSDEILKNFESLDPVIRDDINWYFGYFDLFDEDTKKKKLADLADIATLLDGKISRS